MDIKESVIQIQSAGKDRNVIHGCKMNVTHMQMPMEMERLRSPISWLLVVIGILGRINPTAHVENVLPKHGKMILKKENLRV